MNVRATGVMLAIFVVLAAAVWWFEFREPPKPAETSTIPITDVKPEDVNRVEVVDADKSVVVERTGNGWRLIAPEAADADAPRVTDLLNRLTRANATRKLENVGDLAQYGLAQPPARIGLTRTDGTVVTLLIGGRSPDGGSSYLKHQDRLDVLVVPTFVVSDLSRFVSDPPKQRPTPTPLLIPATPAGGVSTPPPAVSPSARP